MNSMAFLFLANSSPEVDKNQKMELTIGSLSFYIGPSGSTHLSDPVKSGPSASKIKTITMSRSSVGSSSKVNSLVSFAAIENTQKKIKEFNGTREEPNIEGTVDKSYDSQRYFTTGSSGVSRNIHQLCVNITEAVEENDHADNAEVDAQVDKSRSNGKKEKKKIHVSTGEWRIIMSAINHGTEVPTNSSREVLMGYQYALHQHRKKLREEKDEFRRSQENNSMSSGAYWDKYSDALESSRERHRDPKRSRRTTAWAREESRIESISAHPSDDEEDFVQETPEAALVAAQAYLLTTQPEPGDPQEHMHQAAIRSLGLVKDRLRKHPPEKKATHHKEKRKESFKRQPSQSETSESLGDEKRKAWREDARNIIMQARVNHARYAWKEENYEVDEKEIGALCFTQRVRRTRVPKGFKLPHDQQKYDGSQEPTLWLSDYLQVVQILGGTRATAMQSLQLYLTGVARSWLNTLPNDSIGSWGELESQFTRNFCSTYKCPASLEEIKSCIQRKDKTLCSYIQRWSIIENSAEDVSDEWAVDAFSVGLHRLDLVEELGRTKPRTVSELMEVANRFVDGEDVYNNKRGRSPEFDRARRQRQRYRNEDSHARQNQIATGYERRNEEGYESREFQGRGNHGEEKPKYSGPSAEDMLHGPCRIHYMYLDGKRVSNHQMKDCRTLLRLQSALDPNQGTRQGGKSTSQGYQMQRLAKHLVTRV
jgi:hypothetical protein